MRTFVTNIASTYTLPTHCHNTCVHHFCKGCHNQRYGLTILESFICRSPFCISELPLLCCVGTLPAFSEILFIVLAFCTNQSTEAVGSKVSWDCRFFGISTYTLSYLLQWGYRNKNLKNLFLAIKSARSVLQYSS